MDEWPDEDLLGAILQLGTLSGPQRACVERYLADPRGWQEAAEGEAAALVAAAVEGEEIEEDDEEATPARLLRVELGATVQAHWAELCEKKLV